jgi:hypothetical protein
MRKYLCGLKNCISSLTKEYDTLVGAALVRFLEIKVGRNDRKVGGKNNLREECWVGSIK